MLAQYHGRRQSPRPVRMPRDWIFFRRVFRLIPSTAAARIWLPARGLERLGDQGPLHLRQEAIIEPCRRAGQGLRQRTRLASRRDIASSNAHRLMRRTPAPRPACRVLAPISRAVMTGAGQSASDAAQQVFEFAHVAGKIVRLEALDRGGCRASFPASPRAWRARERRARDRRHRRAVRAAAACGWRRR